jgi:uncharacterized membrane protein YeaQ/YmgE (transglycosylase-associated protein family)
MFEVIGTIIFGAIIGVLARIVMPGKQPYGWIVTVLLGVGGALIGYWVWGASRGRQHLRHRLDPLGDQRRWGGDLELWVHGTHAQRQERHLLHHLVPLCLGQFRAIDPLSRPVRVSTSPTFSTPTNTGSVRGTELSHTLVGPDGGVAVVLWKSST